MPCPLPPVSPTFPVTPTQEDRGFSGSQQSPIVISSPSSPLESYGSRVNWSAEMSTATSIGNSYVPSTRRRLFANFARRSGVLDTTNSQEVTQQNNTAGRNSPEFQELSSNSEQESSSETASETGMPSGNLLNQELWIPSLFQSVFKVTGLSEQYRRILLSRLRWNETVMSFLVLLTQESRSLLGSELVWTLTLKIQDPSFGVVTMVTDQLSLMNFEVELISRISSAGQIAIRSLWKLKDLVVPSPLPPYSSPPTYRRYNGIQNLTPER